MVRGIRKDTGELLGSDHVQLFDGVGWVEVEPDTVDGRQIGRWNIVEIDKANNRITVECSECGMVEEMYLTTYGMGHNYCHSCGACLRGE